MAGRMPSDLDAYVREGLGRTVSRTLGEPIRTGRFIATAFTARYPELACDVRNAGWRDAAHYVWNATRYGFRRVRGECRERFQRG